MNLMKTLAICFGLTTAITACKKEVTPIPSPNGPTTGTVKIQLEHTWGEGGTNFQLNKNYVNPANGDTMNFSTFKYYVSNVQLKKADGTWWSHPESYFLVDLSDLTSERLSLNDVPNGSYTAITYTIGVDSTRNVSGAQTGALSTTKGMFWSWNTGYIMVKTEGTSPQSSTGEFKYHLGGFQGANNLVASNTHNFGTENLLVTGGINEIHLSFNTATTWMNFAGCAVTNMIMMPGTTAKNMATDFRLGFEFEHLHN